jgi:ribose-phosphate pyrophosphokinase
MTAVSVQSLPSCTLDAKRLAVRLGVPAHEIGVHPFPDGEIRVTVGPVTQTAIVYASLDRPNQKLIALLLAAEALRRQGCTRIILVAPYLCYMRQDTAFHPGEAISQKAVGRFIAGLVDRVITVDAHLHRTLDIGTIFPNTVVENLSAISAIATSLQTSGLDPTTVLIGPDAESRQWVGNLANMLHLNCVIASKVRRGDRLVAVELSDRTVVAGRPALIVDDIVSSGGTLTACAKALAAAGATTIDAMITHALFPVAMLSDFTEAGIRSLRSTHSVPHPTNAVLLDDLFVNALHAEVGNVLHRGASA